MPEITSFDLHPMASAPQGIDNAFLPDTALTLMLESKNNSPALFSQIDSERQSAVKREWIRALIYSPDTFLNRAFAVNEPVILDGVRRHPEALDKLFRNQRLAVHLLNNSPRKSGAKRREENIEDLLEDPPFDVNPAALAVWRQFLTSDRALAVRYLRLTQDEDDAVVDRFPATFRNLCFADNEECRQLLRGLRGIEPDDNTTAEFQRFLTSDLSLFMKINPKATRGAIYKHLVLPPDAPTNLPLVDQNKPFAHELKLIADIAYNANVPTEIGRYTFTPQGLPDSRILPPSLFKRGARRLPPRAAANEMACEYLEAQRLHDTEQFVYVSQEVFDVPDWAQLSVEDVVSFMDPDKCSEWQRMMDAQEAVAEFTGPADFRLRLEKFGEALVEFQRKLAERTRERKWARIAGEGLKIIVRPMILAGGKEVGPWITGTASRLADLTIDLGIRFVQKHGVEQWVSEQRVSVRSMIARVEASSKTLGEVERLASGGGNIQILDNRDARRSE